MRSRKRCSYCNNRKCSSRDFKGRRWFTEPTPPLKIPLGRAVGCLNESQNFRPTWLSKILKKFLLHSTILKQLKFLALLWTFSFLKKSRNSAVADDSAFNVIRVAMDKVEKVDKCWNSWGNGHFSTISTLINHLNLRINYSTNINRNLN